jgi:hypothetical protein
MNRSRRDKTHIVSANLRSLRERAVSYFCNEAMRQACQQKC